MTRWISAVFILLATVIDCEARSVPQYVGSKTCNDCHLDAYSAWSDSHHGWAWRDAVQGNVLGDFNNVSFNHRGFSYLFQTSKDRYQVVADGPDGKATTYPVLYTAGVTPLQQYLVETAEGRIQALDVAWDTERKRWYHLYPDQDVSAGQGMHWTGSYKNWNARCAECHATGFEKNAAPQEGRYQSRWAEIGVGCESCHGPGEAHLAWAKDRQVPVIDRWGSTDARGLVLDFSSHSQREELNQCAQCHARRGPLGTTTPVAGADFSDHYRLAELREGLYYPDGQIQDEVYVYGSFLQSKMYAKGVQCSDCHDPHSGKLRKTGNSLCIRCHNPQGNTAFPSLKNTLYDDPAHHHHATGSEGARCVSCHMPDRLYMGVDARRDHSFRVPRPDLSRETGSPDACSRCHSDRASDWPAKQVRRWYPEGRHTQSHYGELFAAARTTTDAKIGDRLVTLAMDLNQAAIVRATALSYLPQQPSWVSEQQVQSWLGDDSPLVRRAAVGVTRGMDETERLRLLMPLLSDPLRSVRIEVVRNLLDLVSERYPQKAQKEFLAAIREYQTYLLAQSDYPETQMAIGGTALVMRNLNAAESAFRQAVSMDPQLVDAWVMLARLQLYVQDWKGAHQTLEQGLAANPGNMALLRMLNEIRTK